MLGVCVQDNNLCCAIFYRIIAACFQGSAFSNVYYMLQDYGALLFCLQGSAVPAAIIHNNHIRNVFFCFFNYLANALFLVIARYYSECFFFHSLTLELSAVFISCELLVFSGEVTSSTGFGW